MIEKPDEPDKLLSFLPQLGVCITIDKHQNITQIHPVFLKLLKYQEPEILQKPYQAFFSEKSKELLNENGDLSSCHPVNLELADANGHIKNLSFLVIQSDQELTLCLWNAYEQLQKIQQEKASIWEKLFDNAPLGLCLLNQNKISFVNQQLCKMTYYEKDELTNLNLTNLFSQPGDWNLIKEDSTLSNDSFISREVKWKTRIGTEFDVLINLTHLDEPERNIDMAVFALDISEVKDVEYALLESEKNLTQHLEEIQTITEELRVSNDELSDINLQLQEANFRLSESEKTYKSMFQDNTSIMLLIDPDDGKIVDANHAACQFYGYMPAEFRNMYIDEINLYDPELIRNDLYKVKNDNSNYFRFKHKLANGSFRDVEVYSGPVTVEKRKLLYSIIHDVTDRVEVQRKHLKLLEQFKKLVDTIPNGIDECDADGTILFSNTAHYQMMKMEEGELIGKSITDFMDREDKEELCNFYKYVMEIKPVPTPFIARQKTKDGEYIDVQLDWNYLKDEQDQITGFIVVISDITERKKNEAALTESENKFRNLVENIDEAFWLRDLNTDKMIYLSPGYEKIWSSSREKALDNPESLFDQIHPDDKDLVRAKLFSPSMDFIEDIECRIIKPGGSVVWVMIKSFVLKEGSNIHQIGLATDITERKRTNQHILAQNVELKKINQELDQFVYSVSHNLRSPLTSILGLVNLLKITDDPQQVDEMLKLIENSIIKLDETIHEIIDYSKNARMEVVQEAFDVEELLEDVLERLKYLYQKKSIKILKEVSPHKIFRSDASRLRVVLINLISNAIKYYDPNKPIPYVKINIEPHQKGLKIIVSDNGIGIPEKETEKIFKMFYRATELSSGAGLGLAIVKEVLDKLNGMISVKSNYGFGSDFIIIIPTTPEMNFTTTSS
ncbi:MAG: PAS domain-containing sensor histidine kinase [Candidatus Cyclobacteriaceae bacterium M3_2C_046]